MKEMLRTTGDPHSHQPFSEQRRSRCKATGPPRDDASIGSYLPIASLHRLIHQLRFDSEDSPFAIGTAIVRCAVEIAGMIYDQSRIGRTSVCT